MIQPAPAPPLPAYINQPLGHGLQPPLPLQALYRAADGTEWYWQPDPQPAPGQAPAQAVNYPAQAVNYAAVQMPFGVDVTGQEALARNLASADGNGINRPQSFGPSDPDPLKNYWCREADGTTWVIRNRLTIESGDVGECQWFIDPTNNSIYATLKPR